MCVANPQSYIHRLRSQNLKLYKRCKTIGFHIFFPPLSTCGPVYGIPLVHYCTSEWIYVIKYNLQENAKEEEEVSAPLQYEKLQS